MWVQVKEGTEDKPELVCRQLDLIKKVLDEQIVDVFTVEVDDASEDDATFQEVMTCDDLWHLSVL